MSSLSNIKQQIDGFLKMAEDQKRQLELDTSIRGTRKLRKEVAEISKVLNDLNTRILSATKSVGLINRDDIRKELVVCGNKLVVIARKVCKPKKTQEKELVLPLSLPTVTQREKKHDFYVDGEEQKAKAQAKPKAAGRRHKMLALAIGSPSNNSNHLQELE